MFNIFFLFFFLLSNFFHPLTQLFFCLDLTWFLLFLILILHRHAPFASRICLTGLPIFRVHHKNRNHGLHTDHTIYMFLHWFKFFISYINLYIPPRFPLPKLNPANALVYCLLVTPSQLSQFRWSISNSKRQFKIVHCYFHVY